MRCLMLSLALLGILTQAACATEAVQNSQALRSFLQNYLSKDLEEGFPYQPTRYSAAAAPLNEDKRLIFVYLTGTLACGSGGCGGLIIEDTGKSFRVLEDFSLVSLPISVLPATTHGWHDLAFHQRGGGVADRIVVLQFNGSRYVARMGEDEPRLDIPPAYNLPVSTPGELLFP